MSPLAVRDPLQESATLKFAEKARELKSRGREIISLGLGEPDFDTPEHIKEATIQAIRDGLTRYSAAAGLPELRTLVALKLTRDNGIKAEPNEIIVTPGAKNALAVACMAVLRPGDEVINLTPCYVSNNPILRIAQSEAIVHQAPLLPDEFKLDRKRINSLVGPKTRLIVLNYPNNPTGKMIDPEDVDFLRELARDNDLYLLCDEIYEKMPLTGAPHVSLGSFDDIRDKVITVNGFSKAYSMTGWRIGYVHAHREPASTMVKINQHINTNTAVFIQMAAVAALKGPQEHIGRFIDKLKARGRCYERFLAEAGVTGSHIEGGFFGFINISSTGLKSDDFCARLLDDKGVAMIPGVAFGADFDDWVRVSLANKTELVEEGLTRTKDFIVELCEEKRGLYSSPANQAIL